MFLRFYHSACYIRSFHNSQHFIGSISNAFGLGEDPRGSWKVAAPLLETQCGSWKITCTGVGADSLHFIFPNIFERTPIPQILERAYL